MELGIAALPESQVSLDRFINQVEGSSGGGGGGAFNNNVGGDAFITHGLRDSTPSHGVALGAAGLLKG